MILESLSMFFKYAAIFGIFYMFSDEIRSILKSWGKRIEMKTIITAMKEKSFHEEPSPVKASAIKGNEDVSSH
jgi:hypothetical protein